jgi:hypothetical protein
MPAVEHLEILGLVPFVHRPSPFEAYPALLASMPQLKTAVLEHLVRSSKPDSSLRDRMNLICTTWQAEWAQEEAAVWAFAASVHGEWEVEMQREWPGRIKDDVYRVCISSCRVTYLPSNKRPQAHKHCTLCIIVNLHTCFVSIETPS